MNLYVITSAANAAILYVSPTGDDSANGDAAHPWQTITRAANWAEAGDTVLIEPGIYRESVAVKNSGQPDKPITFAAQKDGTAIITGADPLTMWVAVPDHPGQFIADWPHDFIIDHNADGSPIRSHGAPPPVGCAEQILWHEHPLRQVMKSADLAPNTFFVDWDYHTLTVWLPGNIDPRLGGVEGSVRSDLFAPFNQNDTYADVRNITIRNLVFQDAANFAQRGGVILGTGWHAIHCTVQNNNAGGMSLDGDNILVDGCILQFNGFCGISGGGDNNTLESCIVRGNNRKSFPPDWEGGGGKFLRTNHLRIINHQSYDNVGPGLWLDTDNLNYSITHSVFHGNRGLDDDRQGCGIYLEVNPGPGAVTDNISYSNTGGGITLAESSNITVQGNTLVDNGYNIELRNMPDRDNYHLQQITITHNRFKEWRKAAIGTGLGNWTTNSAKDWNLTIDENFYDPPPEKPFASWADSPVTDLASMRSALGIEQNGAIQSILFQHTMDHSQTISDPTRPTIAASLKNATVGNIVTIPANCRSPLFPDQTCAVFDWDNSCVLLTVPQNWRGRLSDALGQWPTGSPVMLDVRIDQINPGPDIRGTLTAVR